MNLFFTVLDCIYCIAGGQVFLRFASLCRVFPLNVVRGIVRSLLVLSTFVLGGGGGSVMIGQCMSICMGHSGGDRYFLCYNPQ